MMNLCSSQQQQPIQFLTMMMIFNQIILPKKIYTMNTTASAPENNQVAIIHNSIEIFRSAPEVLKENQLKTQKALAVGGSVLDQWHQAWAIEDETERMEALSKADERSNTYLVNCGNAIKQQKDLRAAITQMMDNFKKMFTEAENEIDKAKPNTIPAKIQNNRDTYAQESFKITERKRQEAEREAAKKKDAIELRSNAEIRLFNKYSEYLLAQKTKIQNSFNAITLADFEDKSVKLKAYTPALKPEVITGFELGLYSSFHTKDEIAAFITEVTENKLDEFTSNYAAELTLLRDDLIDNLPSKKAELDEQKRLNDEAIEAERKANKEKDEAKKKQLQELADKAKADKEKAAQEKLDREREDAIRMQNESDAAKKQAEQEADIKKQGEQTMVMFEQEAIIAETASTAEVRQGYEIIVLHPVGYTQVFQLWFENEGKNLPVDKMGNTKLDQMKTWAEKYALKSNVKIDSKFLKYDESFKAVNRKAK
jgi:hypothetical protein